MGPTRTRHLTEYCESFPSFGVDVKNANIIETNVVSFDVDVIVASAINNKKLVLSLLIA